MLSTLIRNDTNCVTYEKKKR